jgi:DNA-binding LytR/AlgR family response regulator
MSIRCLIVDDEPLALDVLEHYIDRLPSLHLVARCGNAIEAGEYLRAEGIDLVFLDIQMPQMTGLEFLRSLRTPPLVVFTTAYPNYAVEGFNLDALDYLLKPVSFERFLKAVNKAQEYLELRNRSQRTADEPPDHFFVREEGRLVRIAFDDVLYIESLEDYVRIYTRTRRIVALQTMKHLESFLPKPRFVRIHRSFLVAFDAITSVTGTSIQIGGTSLPIGKSYRDDFFRLVQQ